jgi:hypothetical protein
MNPLGLYITNNLLAPVKKLLDDVNGSDKKHVLISHAAAKHQTEIHHTDTTEENHNEMRKKHAKEIYSHKIQISDLEDKIKKLEKEVAHEHFPNYKIITVKIVEDHLKAWEKYLMEIEHNHNPYEKMHLDTELERILKYNEEHCDKILKEQKDYKEKLDGEMHLFKVLIHDLHNTKFYDTEKAMEHHIKNREKIEKLTYTVLKDLNFRRNGIYKQTASNLFGR